MSEDDRQSLANRQEILPPLRQSVSSVPDVSQLPTGMFGISLFARARYASEQKQIESYTRLVNAKNLLVSALETQFDLAVSFARASGRASQVPIYREIGRSQADLEFGLIQDQIDGLKERRELNNLAYQEEKARRQLRTAQANRALEQFKTPPEPAEVPKAPQPPPTMADKIRKVGMEIDEIERAFTEERDRRVRAAGGEDKLPAGEIRRLGQFELMKNKALNDIIAELGK